MVLNLLQKSLFVLGGILIVILIIALIYWLLNKNKQILDKNKIGFVSKTMINKIKVFASINNLKILINILLENNFSLNKLSLIPGLVVSKNKSITITKINKLNKLMLI